MMLQSSTKRTQALGSAGVITSAGHSYLNTVERVVVDDITKVGAFVQSNANANEAINASGSAISGSILGVVVKDELRSYATDTALTAKGSNQTVIVTGNVLIETSLVANQGQYVFLKTADGTLGFADTKTLTDYTYTGWRVEVGNATAVAGIIEITTSRG